MNFVVNSHWGEICLALLASLLGARAYEQSAVVCTPAQSITSVHVVESIYVSTYVEQNTTFGVNNCLTRTVDNAPTTLDEIVIGTSTSIINSVASGYADSSKELVHAHRDQATTVGDVP